MSLFSNLSLQLSFNQTNSISFGMAVGFSTFTPSSSYYYVTDWLIDKIFILNESWSHISSKTFYSPSYLTTIGSSLYATGSNNWKLDQNLNIMIQYNATGTAAYTITTFLFIFNLSKFVFNIQGAIHL